MTEQERKEQIAYLKKIAAKADREWQKKWTAMSKKEREEFRRKTRGISERMQSGTPSDK